MAGIEPIPKADRNLGGLDFFMLWAGAAVSLAEIWAGGLIVPLGLTLGVWIILLGHLIGNTPLALGGLIGSRWGIPTMVSVRPSFGIRGSCFAAALNVIQLIGWTAVMLIVCGGAADAISTFYGFSNPPLWIVLSGIVTTLWAIVGHRIWKWLQRISVIALLILCTVMTYSPLSTVRLEHALSDPPGSEFSIDGGHGPRDCHADFVATVGVRLLAFREKLQVEFLGHMDRLLHRILLDVSRGSRSSLGHKISRPFRCGDESHGGIWMGHSCSDHRSFFNFYHDLFGYLLHSDLWIGDGPQAGRTKGDHSRRSPGDSHCAASSRRS